MSHAVRPFKQPSSGSSSSKPAHTHTPEYDDDARPYVIVGDLGKGSFATVYKGYHEDTRQQVAIKAVKRDSLSTKLFENLQSEIQILKSLSHRHITKLIDIVRAEKHIYLIMEFCAGGDLTNYIKKRGRVEGLEYVPAPGAALQYYPHPRTGGLDELVVRSFLRQLARALKFLRHRNLIHRDIKPQNLLLSPASPAELARGHPVGVPILKVADFGFARSLPNAMMAETLCGSPLYMAPEILRYEKYDAKADLWSVGAVLYEMAVGKAPFRAQNHIELLRKIEGGRGVRFPDEDSAGGGGSATPTPTPGGAGGGAGGGGAGGAGKQGGQGGTPTQAQGPAGGSKDLPVPPDIKQLIRMLLRRNPVERASFEEFFGSVALARSKFPRPQASVEVSSTSGVGEGSGLAGSGGGEGGPGAGEGGRQAGGREGGGGTGREGREDIPWIGGRPPTPEHHKIIPPEVLDPNAMIPPSRFNFRGVGVGAQGGAGASGHHREQGGRPTLGRSPSSASPASAAAAGSSRAPYNNYYNNNNNLVAPRRQHGHGHGHGHSRSSSSSSSPHGHSPSSSPGTHPPSSRHPTPNDALGEGVGGVSRHNSAKPRTKRLSTEASYIPGETEEDGNLRREYVLVEDRGAVEFGRAVDEISLQPRRPLYDRKTTLTTTPTPTSANSNKNYEYANTPDVASPVSATATSPRAIPSPTTHRPSSSPSTNAANITFPPTPHTSHPPVIPPPPPLSSSPSSMAQRAAANALNRALSIAKKNLGIFGSGGGGGAGTGTGTNSRAGSHSRGDSGGAVGNGVAPTTPSGLGTSPSPSPRPSSSPASGGSARPQLIRTGSAVNGNEAVDGDAQAQAQGGGGGVGGERDPLEEELLASLEELAQKTDVLTHWADEMYEYVKAVPQKPLPDPSKFTKSQHETDKQARKRKNADMEAEYNAVTCVAVYMLLMGFSQKGIDKLRRFQEHMRMRFPEGAGGVWEGGQGYAVSEGFDEALNWFKDHYFKCYDRAALVKTWLPVTYDGPKSWLDQLVYDRALLLSRTAARKELLDQMTTPDECEKLYEESLWCLYALQDDLLQTGNPFMDEDRETIATWIKRTKLRLVRCRARMAMNHRDRVNDARADQNLADVARIPAPWDVRPRTSSGAGAGVDGTKAGAGTGTGDGVGR